MEFHYTQIYKGSDREIEFEAYGKIYQWDKRSFQDVGTVYI